MEPSYQVEGHIRERQLPQALALQPDLASVLTGMNHALAPSLDAEAVADDLATVIRELQQAGSFVVTACLPRTVPVLRLLPRGMRRKIEGRLQQVSDVIRDIAAETTSGVSTSRIFLATTASTCAASTGFIRSRIYPERGRSAATRSSVRIGIGPR
jgi:hypothetical protein